MAAALKILVTGGGGFLGGGIARALRARGLAVRSLSRGKYPELAVLGIKHYQGDLTDKDAVLRASRGCGCIYHVAALAGVWGPYKAYHDANVVGTQNILEACKYHRIPVLVFTSSPSVTFHGVDQSGVDESEPYPSNFLAHYPHTKAQAEKLVLSANGTRLSEDRRLTTVALRPHLVWGPGDNHLVPRILDKGKQGKLRIIGRSAKKVDHTFIDNAVQAHLNAGDRLLSNGLEAACAGKAYFISNGEPIPIHELINRILECGGQAPVTKRVSPTVAYWVGALMEAWYALTGKQEEPPMTRFVARQLSTEHWFNLDAARRELGYLPLVNLEEGLERLKRSLRKEHVHKRRPAPPEPLPEIATVGRQVGIQPEKRHHKGEKEIKRPSTTELLGADSADDVPSSEQPKD